MGNKGKISLKTVIYFVALIIIVVIAENIYSKYNYNDYVKGVREAGKTSFTRDSDVVYSGMDSYKIENRFYNDAMFYKKINVEPNTAYRVTCMVKTENVVNQDGEYAGGAQISINDTTECSEAISGTTDWTKLTFMFNSNSRTSVELGFRLGGYDEYSKGTAWFSDFTIEEGITDKDTEWNMVCFIIDNISTSVSSGGSNRNVNFGMSYEDVRTIKDNMKRLQNGIVELSGNKMSINYDVIEITEPLTTISYDEENEYYVSQEDVKPLIDDYVKKNEYDYIYVAVRLGDLSKSNDILVHDWIGLGSMRYNGIGYSNIRLPDSRNSTMYKYSGNNTFPEEVFVHEFLHTLERNEKENGNNIADLHDHELYGYSQDSVSGLEEWYKDYMQNTIKNDEGKGLTDFAYSSKPIQNSNFEHSMTLDYLDEPDNIIEEISILVGRIFNK